VVEDEGRDETSVVQAPPAGLRVVDRKESQRDGTTRVVGDGDNAAVTAGIVAVILPPGDRDAVGQQRSSAVQTRPGVAGVHL